MMRSSPGVCPTTQESTFFDTIGARGFTDTGQERGFTDITT